MDDDGDLDGDQTKQKIPALRSEDDMEDEIEGEDEQHNAQTGPWLVAVEYSHTISMQGLICNALNLDFRKTPSSGGTEPFATGAAESSDRG